MCLLEEGVLLVDWIVGNDLNYVCHLLPLALVWCQSAYYYLRGRCTKLACADVRLFDAVLDEKYNPVGAVRSTNCKSFMLAGLQTAIRIFEQTLSAYQESIETWKVIILELMEKGAAEILYKKSFILRLLTYICGLVARFWIESIS